MLAYSRRKRLEALRPLTMRWVLLAQLTSVLFFTIILARPENVRRRSLLEFQNILSRLTNRSWAAYLEYGNFCGLGGSGNAVDDVDQCCRDHDVCYAKAAKDHCPPQTDPYTGYYIAYTYKFMDNDDAECVLEGSDPCRYFHCNCDVEAARCMKNSTYYEEHKRPFINILYKAITNPQLGASFVKALKSIFTQSADS